MSMEDIFKDHQQELKSIIDEYGITYLALFGSRARGDHRNDSDYDFLVEYDKPLGLEFFGISQEFEQILKAKVDVVTKKSLSKYVRPYVKPDLKVIYQKS